MRDGDESLRGRERAREGRVRVPVYEHCVGGLAIHHRFERGEHPRRLRAARSERDAELLVGRRQPELRKEHRREPIVEVLAGVHEHLRVDLAQSR